MRTWLFLLSLAISTAWGQSKGVGPAAPTTTPEGNRANLILSAALGDKNPDVRKQAVAALGLIGAREPYISQIYTGLKDKDVYVRLAAVASLVDTKDKGTIPALVKALDDDAPEVSFSAARALWTLGDPGGRTALLAVLSGESKTTSKFLTAQKRDMLRMFHTPKTLMMFALKQGVGFAPVPGLGQGVSSLQEILGDASVSGRAATALLLANDRSPEVLDALKDALQDKDASVRAAAIHALALRNDPALAPLLVAHFDDPKEAVRLRAAAGYLRLAGLRKPPPGKPPVPAKKAAPPAAGKQKQ